MKQYYFSNLKFNLSKLMCYKGDILHIQLNELLQEMIYMPSTTNTLEAMHGHINENCPARNCFFQANQRVICELDSKYRNIDLGVKHNYIYKKNTAMKKCSKRYHFTKQPKDIVNAVKTYCNLTILKSVFLVCIDQPLENNFNNCNHFLNFQSL